ncbi:MAG: diaminopimelate epimerase [Clostridiaceae bacterium]|nr:diaminopimelate epimerase [Clostridiaceae bacterium]
MKFTKMHGIGNDYIYFDCINSPCDFDPQSAAKVLSHRHFGVGGDGIVLIEKSLIADFKMRMFNSDGSEGKMCGNAIRCVGKFVYEKNYTKKDEITIETKSGIKALKLFVEGGKVEKVRVDMGKAVLEPSKIPVLTDKDVFINEKLNVDGRDFFVTCVSMGNPHAVVFLDEEIGDISKIGPKFEHHPVFPDRVNTEFVQVIDNTTLKMRVWERGSGETMACGTGACASVVAAVLNGYCGYDTPVKVILSGGELEIIYQSDGTVFMSGGATFVFEGELL